MAEPHNSFITLRQLAVLISLLFLFGAGGGVLATKADKAEVVRLEERMNKKIQMIQKDLKEDIQDIKRVQDKMDAKQDEIYKLILALKK